MSNGRRATGPAPRAKNSVELEPAQLARCVGTYEINDALTLIIRLEGGSLFASATGFPEGRLHAESPVTFFLEEPPVEMTFLVDDAGVVSAVEVRGFSVEFRGTKR